MLTGLFIDIIGFIWLSKLTPKDIEKFNFNIIKKTTFGQVDKIDELSKHIENQINSVNVFNSDIKTKTKPIIKLILFGLILQLLAAFIDFFEPHISSFCQIPEKYI